MTFFFSRLALFFSLVTVVAAQERNTAESENMPNSESDLPAQVIDEVVVHGDKTLATLRQAVYRAEEDFWATFNSMNEEDEYDVRCYYEAPTGTRIKRHVCRANFVSDATSQEYERWKDSSSIIVLDARAVIMSKRSKFEEKVTQLILENPQLAQSLTTYHSAKDTYTSERKRKCEGRRVFCGQ